MSSNYLTAEDIDENETRGFRGKKRSLSLNNIADSVKNVNDAAIHEEKSSFLRTGGDRLKGLKKKLNIKLSKSNTDLVATNTGIALHSSKDSNKLDLIDYQHHVEPKKSPREARKYFKEQQKKKNKTDLSTDSLCDIPVNKFNDKPFHLQSSDTLDLLYPPPSVINEPVVNYEYLDDLGICAYDQDETDSAVLPHQQIEKFWKKIEKIREELVHLQAIRDDNVSEYLKTTDNNSSDSINNAKVKVNFEKNNQKTNIAINILQKKLDKYLQQVKEIEEHGGVHGTKRIMKVVQDSVRSGASSITEAVAKPLESFNNFIKKDKKISSTENVYITLTTDDEMERSYHSVQTNSDEENGSSSNLMRDGVLEGIRKKITNQDVINEGDEVDVLRVRIEQLEKENEASKDYIDQFKDRLNWVMQSMQDESYKTDQLQVRLNDLYNQWNDLTELHQNEMMGMKDEMDRTMERIECVAYRFTERTGDLEENLEKCATKISKIEKQQHEQQPIDNFLDMDAKVLFSRFLSFIINICVVVIFVVCSVVKMIMPFVSNKVRLLVSGVVLTAFILVWKNLDHEIFNVFYNFIQVSPRNNPNFKT